MKDISRIDAKNPKQLKALRKFLKAQSISISRRARSVATELGIEAKGRRFIFWAMRPVKDIPISEDLIKYFIEEGGTMKY